MHVGTDGEANHSRQNFHMDGINVAINKSPTQWNIP